MLDATPFGSISSFSIKLFDQIFVYVATVRRVLVHCTKYILRACHGARVDETDGYEYGSL